MRPCAFRSICRTCTHRATRQSAHNTVEHICAATGQLHPYDVRYCRNHKTKTNKLNYTQ